MKSIKATQAISCDLNIIYTKVLSRVEESKYHSLGALSTIFMAEISRKNDELALTEDLCKGVKFIKARLDGLKESHNHLIEVSKDIWSD